MTTKAATIFKKGSTTYFNSSLFFPQQAREDIFALYAFVRTADDFVDQSPSDIRGFETFYSQYVHRDSSNPIVAGFLEIEEKYTFKKEWVEAFFGAMRMDLEKSVYHTIAETQKYMYGSAEVIGLFISKILQLPDASFEYARLQGRSMQFINMIRDIAEDIVLGRQYLPSQDLEKFNLQSLTKPEIIAKPKDFQAFMLFEIDRYLAWETEARKGYKFIPKRYRVAIKTAADMYRWTAKVIATNPFIVFERKVKPSKFRVWTKALQNIVTA